jgi:hypothetical protein
MATKMAINLPVDSPRLVQNAYIYGADNRMKLLFSSTATSQADWQFRLPTDYSTGLTAKIQYSMATATSGTVIFNVYIMAVSGGDAADIDTNSFDSANAGTETVPGVAGRMSEISIALSNVDSVSAGDLVVVRLERNTADTSTGYAEILDFSIEFEVTVDSGSGETTQTVTEKTDDYNVASDDFGNALYMNSADDKTFTLPSVSGSDIGKKITMFNLGTGKLTVATSDSDTIADSDGGYGIYTEQQNTAITLQLLTASAWHIVSSSGIWITTGA